VWSVDQYYKNPQVSREELEQYEIDRERVRDLQESYKKVERVLAEKDEDGQSHFFCKWTSKFVIRS
jgi:chromodomain-helicase-DNA-binding protein 1